MEINILVVDDDRDIRMLLENYLKKLEVEKVNFTDSAQKTYKLLNIDDLKADPKVELIILDIVLGDENGIDICKKIKKHPANQKLEKMALVDGLTGISNRRLFDKTLKKELKRAKREKSYISLIMIDIDNFKAYNDTYGHQAGDECLKKVASVLDENTKRAADFAARYGGEEFAVILPDTAKDGAVKIAEDIRKGIINLKLEHKNSVTADYVTVSLGISSIQVEKEINQQLIKSFFEKADQALYHAKEKGKNQTVYHSFE